MSYYRAGSAASRLSPADVPDEALDGTALVHLTGITAALSPTARELVLDLALRARARGITVLFARSGSGDWETFPRLEELGGALEPSP